MAPELEKVSKRNEMESYQNFFAAPSSKGGPAWGVSLSGINEMLHSNMAVEAAAWT